MAKTNAELEAEKKKDQQKKAEQVAGENRGMQARAMEQQLMQTADEVHKAHKETGGDPKVTKEDIRDMVRGMPLPENRNMEPWIAEIVKNLQQTYLEMKLWRETPSSKKATGTKALKTWGKDTWNNFKEMGLVEGVIGSVKGQGYLGLAVNATVDAANYTTSSMWKGVKDVCKWAKDKAADGIRERMGPKKAEQASPGDKVSFDFDDEGKITHYEIRDDLDNEVDGPALRERAADLNNYLEKKHGCKMVDGQIVDNVSGAPLSTEALDELREKIFSDGPDGYVAYTGSSDSDLPALNEFAEHLDASSQLNMG